MAGLAQLRRVELDCNGTWTNITTWVDGDIVIGGGRQSPSDGLTAGTVKFYLRNHDGRWMPGNPFYTDSTGAAGTNPIYPWFRRGARLRVAVWSPVGSSYWCAPIVYIDEIRPTWDAATQASARVEVNALDPIASMLRNRMYCDFVEQAQLQGNTYTDMTNVDAWEMVSSGSGYSIAARGLDGIGSPARPHNPGTLSGSGGSYSVTAAEGSALGECISLEPSESSSTSVRWTGRAVVVGWADEPAAIQFWVRIPSDTNLENSSGGYTSVLATLYDASRAQIGLIRWYHYDMSNSWMRVESIDGATTLDIWQTGITGLIADGEWHCVSLAANAAGSNWLGSTGPGPNLSWTPSGPAPEFLAATRYLAIGGDLASGLSGSARRALKVDVGPIYVGQAAGASNQGVIDFTRGLMTKVSSYTRILDLLYYIRGRGIVTSTGNIYAPDDTPTQLITPTAGTTLGETFDTVLRTADARLTMSPASTWGDVLAHGSVQVDTNASGANVPSYTVRLGRDDQVGLELASSFEDRPSRVNASWPLGEFVMINEELESQGVLQDASITTFGASAGDAAVAGGVLLAQNSPPLWVRSVTVDLLTAEADLWAMVAGLRSGMRLRLDMIPSAYFGRTWLDYRVEGWTFTLGSTAATIRLELSPLGYVAVIGSSNGSDATPRVSLPDDAALTAGITASSTSLTIASSEPLTTAGAAYPMVITIDQEDISIPSAPASAVSPQTVTGVTRGVSPTIAGVHASGSRVTLRDGIILSA